MNTKEAVWIVPPAMVGMMSGCSHAIREVSGKTTLVYTDGNKESAIIPNDKWLEIYPAEGGNFFSIVSTVQSLARK
jgi:hypothetical protein